MMQGPSQKQKKNGNRNCRSINHSCKFCSPKIIKKQNMQLQEVLIVQTTTYGSEEQNTEMYTRFLF